MAFIKVREEHQKSIGEIIRFSVVGVFVTALHYGIYLVLQQFINLTVAYSIGYLAGFITNFYLTAYYTFHRKPSWHKGIGFGAAHLCNFLLHIALLNLFVWLGISKALAPVPVYAIAVPINFLMVRFVFKYKRKDGE